MKGLSKFPLFVSEPCWFFQVRQKLSFRNFEIFSARIHDWLIKLIFPLEMNLYSSDILDFVVNLT